MAYKDLEAGLDLGMIRTGEAPAPVFVKRLTFGPASTNDVEHGTAVGVKNLFKIVEGLHILDIKIFKKTLFDDTGNTGALTCTIGDTGDADRFFNDTGLAWGTADYKSLAVIGNAAKGGYRYPAAMAGKYISATTAGRVPTKGQMIIDVIYALTQDVEGIANA